MRFVYSNVFFFPFPPSDDRAVWNIIARPPDLARNVPLQLSTGRGRTTVGNRGCAPERVPVAIVLSVICKYVSCRVSAGEETERTVRVLVAETVEIRTYVRRRPFVSATDVSRNGFKNILNTRTRWETQTPGWNDSRPCRNYGRKKKPTVGPSNPEVPNQGAAKIFEIYIIFLNAFVKNIALRVIKQTKTYCV
jgi:hypothetical protein